MAPSRIEEDLQQHFADRIRALIIDSSDTMQRVDIGNGDIAMLMMAALFREVCGAAWSLELTEEMFLRICQSAYRDYLPQYRKLAKKHKQARKAP